MPVMEKEALLEQFGKRIKSIRIEKNISQTAFAKRCNMDKGSICRIESGKTNVSYITLFKISKALEVKIEKIV